MLLWYNGNEQAFEILYKRHLSLLLSLAVQKTGDRETAKELVQDTFVNLYSQKASMLEIRSVRAYLYVILKNKVLNYYRKESARRRYQEYLASTFGEQDNSTELGIQSREIERQLDHEIENLPPKCRAVFKLSRKEHLSNKDIASRLGISENTVEQHMRKALRDLRSSMGAAGLAALLYLLER
ncbi:RNA polymerase sigma-70 factor [Daejeonella lutea]|uniref:RNA polymerase sigma-70 factor n=1 Tax=Daejeonella lutea TaxID=572036 RepID=UPI0021CDC7B8|nr:RNA polymerase sigma-70 factor [Daejeonella lutea]